MTEKKPNMLIGLDNIQRKPKDEENLNTLFYKMFNTAGGSEILKYLKTLKEVTHHTNADESDEIETAKLVQEKPHYINDQKPYYAKWR